MTEIVRKESDKFKLSRVVPGAHDGIWRAEIVKSDGLGSAFHASALPLMDKSQLESRLLMYADKGIVMDVTRKAIDRVEEATLSKGSESPVDRQIREHKENERRILMGYSR